MKITLTCALVCALAVLSAANGKRLRGVNRSGSEYGCVQGYPIFDGPVDDAATKKIKYWNVNAVRVPLNEDCWLDLNGFPADRVGDTYQKAIVSYVKTLRNNDMKVILDLHWTDGLYNGPSQGPCYDTRATCQKPMPNRRNSIPFWKSVAATFKNDLNIIFDIFNEPFVNRVMSDQTAAWQCWRDGGSACSGLRWEVAGMQDLVDAVRSTGAKNLIIAGGLEYANDLSRWEEFKPFDFVNNIAPAWHSYDFNICNNKDCWEKTIAPLAKKYPNMTVGEIGQEGCSHEYVDKLMPWLDKHNINYIAWTWNVWDCSSGPCLISDFDGTPSGFGVGVKNHLWNTRFD